MLSNLPGGVSTFIRPHETLLRSCSVYALAKESRAGKENSVKLYYFPSPNPQKVMFALLECEPRLPGL